MNYINNMLEEILNLPRYVAVSMNHPVMGAIKESPDGYLIKVEDIRNLLSNAINTEE